LVENPLDEFESLPALGTTVVQIAVQLDGKFYGAAARSDFTITNTGGGVSGFRVVPLTTSWWEMVREAPASKRP
jgi:hypothetical protein